MPYNPALSGAARLSSLGGQYNNGLSYWSGNDPANYFPFVAADALRTTPDYSYAHILYARFGGDSGEPTPVQQWTPAQQSIYGKIWETEGGAPTPTIDQRTGTPTIAPSPSGTDSIGVTKPNSSPWPEWMQKIPIIGSIYKTPDLQPGGFLSFDYHFVGDLIVIVVGILLLAIAAYSIVIPSGSRGRIAEKLVNG